MSDTPRAGQSPDDQRPPTASPRTLYDMLGEEGFAHMASRFYDRVIDDDILGPMYRHAAHEKGEPDLGPSRDRLRDFLVYRFGGPQRYIEQRGHPRLRMRHAPFPIDVRARNRWVELMDGAMHEALDVALAPHADDPRAHEWRQTARDILHKFFADTATFMINRGD